MNDDGSHLKRWSQTSLALKRRKERFLLFQEGSGSTCSLFSAKMRYNPTMVGYVYVPDFFPYTTSSLENEGEDINHADNGHIMSVTTTTNQRKIPPLPTRVPKRTGGGKGRPGGTSKSPQNILTLAGPAEEVISPRIETMVCFCRIARGGHFRNH